MIKSTARRTFLGIIWAILAVLACLEGIWVFRSILKGARPGKTSKTENAFIEAGEAESFAMDSVTPVVQGQFYLVRLEDGGFLALSKKCTHLGCSLTWDGEKKAFICPCHGSSFDHMGEVVTPPAIRGLDSYPIRVENGRILVNIAAPQKWQGAQQRSPVKV